MLRYVAVLLARHVSLRVLHVALRWARTTSESPSRLRPFYEQPLLSAMSMVSICFHHLSWACAFIGSDLCPLTALQSLTSHADFAAVRIFEGHSVCAKRKVEQ